VAQDIVRHFLGRGFVGKAMVVSIDKATALRCTTRCGSIGRRDARVQKELGGWLRPVHDARAGEARRTLAELKQRLRC
jgi:type I restriction enzyme R subunit